mmetsp:Transcript_55204/g.112730  ORF Transcript_55204/g.112730 Transcript_55204/m.112730 type:complete len:90 (+) Transcript_55204:610-879(+)
MYGWLCLPMQKNPKETHGLIPFFGEYCWSHAKHNLLETKLIRESYYAVSDIANIVDMNLSKKSCQSIVIPTVPLCFLFFQATYQFIYLY